MSTAGRRTGSLASATAVAASLAAAHLLDYLFAARLSDHAGGGWWGHGNVHLLASATGGLAALALTARVYVSFYGGRREEPASIGALLVAAHTAILVLELGERAAGGLTTATTIGALVTIGAHVVAGVLWRSLFRAADRAGRHLSGSGRSLGEGCDSTLRLRWLAASACRPSLGRPGAIRLRAPPVRTS